jgi:transcriptional regulator with XRE-family HTH domain
MLTPAHARMARAALKWSLVDLKEKTGLSKTTLVRFEAGLGVQNSTAITLEQTFTNEGITFIYADDVKGPGIQISNALFRRVDATARAAQKGQIWKTKPKS